MPHMDKSYHCLFFRINNLCHEGLVISRQSVMLQAPKEGIQAIQNLSAKPWVWIGRATILSLLLVQTKKSRL